jgi:hypothetical protein
MLAINSWVMPVSTRSAEEFAPIHHNHLTRFVWKSNSTSVKYLMPSARHFHYVNASITARSQTWGGSATMMMTSETLPRSVKH